MSPILFHIYGPLSIQAYGLCIAIGGLIAFYLLCKDTKVQKIISESTLASIFQLTLISGYFGGKIVCMLSDGIIDLLCLLKFWEPGFSILGTVIAIVVTLSIYFYYRQIPALLLLDRVALYAPIVQSFGRLGCFFAGCCYGLPSKGWYSVIYTDPAHIAPLYCSLHPAQLYSAIILFGIFLFLYFIQQHRTKITGVILCSYIMLISIERFLIDFIRWDRMFIIKPAFLQLFSLHQWIALGLCIMASIGILILYKRKK